MQQILNRTGLEGRFFISLLTLALTIVTIWLLANGFISDSATERWATVIAALGAQEVVLENFTFLAPHLPLYLLVPFYYIPGLEDGGAPYLLSIIAAAFLLFLWAHHLREVELSQTRLAMLAVLVVIHPGFLWAATSGSHIALSMVAFYLLYRGFQHIISDHDIHSYISLAVTFVAFFFIDGSAVFIFVALIPLLVVIAPLRTIMVSPVGLYLIVGTPFAFAVATWAYLNWIFEGSFMHFIEHADSAFLGGMLYTNEYPWLLDYGGQFFKPLLAATGYLLIAYPVSVYLLLDTINNNYRFRASFVLLLHPLIAIAIATSQYYLTHPFEILALISAGLMAELTYVRMQTRREFFFLIVFMVVSVVGGWWLFIETANPQMTQWVQSLTGKHTADASKDGDLQVGLWLKNNRLPTLVYERSAFKVVAARGDAEGLVLSFSHDFKSAMRERHPNVRQIAVPEPHSISGRRDWINIRYPHLYDHGMDGFRLVYDNLGWRVYRKVSG
ncbi:hypothetical protein MMIC_P0737 [Mariprofundus micogutta]|uniref:Glycosyltransferase RgtA/B/C/D-like domain-containing protein n=1 Tax=Mariprofundus micogutta TaxID=1921010 RepID=A0A1L8CLR0_9PROT|nr:hypothetical protein [Mariprofundus micogutta]GAV19779.1 hypothetical protein MMIC_P0737 [Mariprofundus micogutta]